MKMTDKHTQAQFHRHTSNNRPIGAYDNEI
jgi:hypothetical protein